MNRFSKLVMLAFSLVMFSLALVACGGEATPAASSNQTVGGSNATANGGLKSVAGAREVEIDTSLQKALMPELPGITDTAFKMYVSDEKPVVLSDNLHKALIEGGYTFALPGKEKPVFSDNSYNGTYTKAGATDLTFIASPLTTGTYSEQDLTKIGADAASARKLIDQVKGKSSLAVVLYGKGLAAQIQASSATTAASTTKAAVTQPSATTAAVRTTVASAATTAAAVATVAAKPTVAPTQAASVAKATPKTVKKGNFVMTVNSVEMPASFVVVGIDNTPKTGMRFVTLDLTIVSEANEDVDANTLYASLKDSKGNKYAASLLGREPELPSQNNIARGERVQGWVTFEVPVSAVGLVFVYEPLLAEPLIIEIPLA